MSRLNDRSGSPRRRVVRGGMHPGWEAFMCAFGAGFFCAIGTISVMYWCIGRVHELWPAILCWAIWIALFIRGGKLAERLRPTDER